MIATTRSPLRSCPQRIAGVPSAIDESSTAVPSKPRPSPKPSYGSRSNVTRRTSTSGLGMAEADSGDATATAVLAELAFFLRKLVKLKLRHDRRASLRFGVPKRTDSTSVEGSIGAGCTAGLFFGLTTIASPPKSTTRTQRALPFASAGLPCRPLWLTFGLPCRPSGAEATNRSARSCASPSASSRSSLLINSEIMRFSLSSSQAS